MIHLIADQLVQGHRRQMWRKVPLQWRPFEELLYRSQFHLIVEYFHAYEQDGVLLCPSTFQVLYTICLEFGLAR